MLKLMNLTKRMIKVTGVLLLSVLLSPCLSVDASEVNYVAEPISFSGSEFIQLSDESDDPAVQEEYGIMMASSGSSSVSMSSRAYYALMSYTTPAFQLVSSGLSADEVYAVTLSFNYSLTPSPTQSDTSLRFRNCHAAFASLLLNSYSNNTLPYSFSGTKTYYLSGETLMASNTCLIRTFLTASNALSFTMNINFNIQVDSCVQVSGDAEAAYNEGYNAGYTAGEDAGYDSGYSAGVSSVDTQSYYNNGYAAGHRIGFAEGQASVDTDSIYNQAYSEGLEDGFDEGVASVDTQSYYNNGYNAGVEAGIASVDTQSYYDAGYSSGYSAGSDDGYDEGYQAGLEEGYAQGFEAGVKAASGSSSGSSLIGRQPSLNMYYNDTKLGVGVSGPEIQSHMTTTTDYYSDDYLIYLKPLYHVSEFTHYDDVIYQGYFDAYLDMYFPKETYDINDMVTFYWSPSLYDLEVFSPSGDPLGYDVDVTVENRSDEYKMRINLRVYMSGSYYGSDVYIRPVIEFSGTGTVPFVIVEYAGAVTNNAVFIRAEDNKVEVSISNQTSELTGGYDDGSGSSMNDSFSSGVNDYQVAEDSLFVSAKTGLNDFEFYDLESVPAMITGISFVGSVMTSMYDQAGGVSGVGIVLSILFSVMIAAMALGLYRWYQSRGGKK